MKKAFLTFIRRKNDDYSFLAIENPSNLISIKECFLRSGQPVIVIKENEKLLGLYLIGNNAELFQIYGEEDFLFFMKTINDLSLLNIKKYNFIKHILIETFCELSIQESKQYKDIFELFEENIFYTTLHTELENKSIKNVVVKELKKLEIPYSIKTRMLDKITKLRNISENYLRKKIDVDLAGYGIYINAFKH
jgi:hypothetical protein